MNSAGQRIKQLRKQHKLTQNDVATFIGVQRVSVSKWESQSDVYNTPKGEHLFKLCQILKTTAEFVLYGHTTYEHQPTDHQPGPAAQENIASYLTKIPLLNWHQVENIETLKAEQLETNEVIFSHLENSSHGYALPVIGDSMISTTGPYSFPEGVLIIFDPKWSDELSDGMFIIAQVDKEIKFRQVKYDGSKAYLHALNPQYPKIFKAFKVIGKVTEMQMKLP